MRDSYAKQIPDEWKNIAKMFLALGDEHRQRIILMFDKGEKLNVTQISQASTLSRPAVSHHLKILFEANILLNQKVGKEVFYWVNKDVLAETILRVAEYVKNNH